MAQIQKSTDYVSRAGTASDPLCVVASAGVARCQLQSMIDNTTLIIESEMFGGRKFY
jgi:hypothetical protein